MPQYDKCPTCFMPMAGGDTVCPHCGSDYLKIKPYAGVLPPFTMLNNRYLVGKVLGKGGFGITYVAKDVMSNTICAIKEYMPSEYSTRSSGSLNIMPYSDDKAQYVFTHGREKFVDEAKTLLKLRNDPIVVDILDYFTQNNTAYLVMEYLDGQDLRKLSKATGGKLEPEFAKTVFVTIASSLMEIHKKNILHRDLSPENIIVTSNGRIKLIDFGAARNFVSTQNNGMSILLKPGFAPPEQYNTKGKQGPWSDVYALCATFYTLVSGKPLVDALFRYRGEEQPSLISMGCQVTKKTSDVIERGMELDYRRRYQNFKELLDDIDIAPGKPVPPKSPVSHTAPNPASTPQPVNSSQRGYSQNHAPISNMQSDSKRGISGQGYQQPNLSQNSGQQIPPVRQNPGYQNVQPMNQGYPQRIPVQQSYQNVQPNNQGYPQRVPVQQNPTPAPGYQNVQPNNQGYPQRVPVQQNPTPAPGYQNVQPNNQGYPQRTPMQQTPPGYPRQNPMQGTPQAVRPYVAAIVGNSICNKVMLNTNDVFNIGRSAQSCRYVISGDTNISRIHCRLRFDGSRFYLCDASSNGTFFENGTRLVKNKEYVITPGTRFYLATRNHMLILNV